MFFSPVPLSLRRSISGFGVATLAIACLAPGSAQEAPPALEAVSKPEVTKPVPFENPPAAKKSEIDALVDIVNEAQPEAAPAPAVMPAPTTRNIDPDADLSEMKANRIEIPAFEAVPSGQLPDLLRSGESTDAQPDPESAFVAQPSGAVSGEVERLRAADTQADSFRAALAVAMDGDANLPATPEASSALIGDPVEIVTPETTDVAPPATVESKKKRGLFSGLANRMKPSETVEEMAEVGRDVVEDATSDAPSGFASWFKKAPKAERVEAPELVATPVEMDAVEEPAEPKKSPFGKLFKKGASDSVETMEEEVNVVKAKKFQFFKRKPAAAE